MPSLLQTLKSGYADAAAARAAVQPSDIKALATEGWILEDLKAWQPKSSGTLTVLGHDVTGTELLVLALGLVVVLGAGK